MLEMALVLVFLVGLGQIFHYSMTMRESLVILLSSVFPADNLRHVFRKLHKIKISSYKYNTFKDMMILQALSIYVVSEPHTSQEVSF